MKIWKLVEAATANLLLQKSGIRYEKEYDTFPKWCSDKNVCDLDEDVLIAYFVDRFKERSCFGVIILC